MIPRLPTPLLLLSLLLLAACTPARPKDSPAKSTAEAEEALPPPKVEDPELRALVDATFTYAQSQDLAITNAQIDPSLPREATPTDGSYFQTHLTWSVDGETVSGSLTRPLQAPEPFPVVVLVHGYGSYKSAMIRQYSGRLAEAGIATFAFALADHQPEIETPAWDTDEVHEQNLRRSVLALRSGLDAIALQTAIDSDHIGAIGVGYGGYVALLAAGADGRIDALAMAGSPGDPLTSTQVEIEVDWNRYIRPADHLAVRSLFSDALPDAFQPGRVIGLRVDCPLLFQLGRNDPRVDSKAVARFLAASTSPMTQRWYDAGILLPDAATVDAVNWMATQLTTHEDH